MSVIAHLTDPHLLEPDGLRASGVGARVRRRYLNALRSIDAPARFDAFVGVLRRAAALGYDHLVITGDLTEEGTRPQFEAVAEAFDAAGVDPARVSLVPGNHDVYEDAGAFAWALRGPLRAFAATSAPGAVVALPDAVVVPYSTARAQRWWRSAGELSEAVRESLAATARRAAGLGVAAILVQHHPPMRVQSVAMHWLDGLLDHAALRPLLGGFPHLAVLHGHLHEHRDRAFEAGALPQVFGAPAVLDDAVTVRRYAVEGTALVPLP